MSRKSFRIMFVAAILTVTALIASPIAAATVTLKFACWDYDLYGYDKALIEAFMKKYPDIKVEVISLPNADFDNKVNIMMSGGEELDVLYAKSVNLFGSLITKNQLADLKPYIARDKLDLKPYGASIAAYTSAGDKIVGLPYRYDRYLLYYNKDVFDAAKVPYPTAQMTWDEFRALAKKLTRGTGKDKVYGALFAPFNYCFLSPGLQEGKGGYVDMDFNLFKEGWQNIYEMMYTDKTAQDWPSLKSVSADQTYFLKGNSGMMVVGTWFMNILATEIASGKTDIRWGATTVPVSKDMAKRSVQASNGSVTPVVMNARTKNPEAAWQLVKFLASEEAGKIAATYLVTPGYNSNAVVEAMTKVKGFDPSAKDAINKSGLAYPPVSGSNKNAGALATMVNKQLELLFTQNQDLNTTVSEMFRLRKEILENS